MPGGAYVTYLNFAETLITLACQITSLFLNLNLVYISLFKPKFLLVKGLSISLMAYLYTHIFMATFALPGNLYMGLSWKPPPSDASNRNPYLLYWLGLVASNYYTASPVLVLMLTLDRCISLKLPSYSFFPASSKGRSLKLSLVWTMLGVVVATCVGNTWVYLLELPLDLTRVSNCEVFPCFAIKNRSFPQLTWKVVISIINLISCSLFFYMLKQSGKAKIIKNRVVKNTILFELFFDVIPAITGLAFNLIVGETPANYLGQYTVMLCYVDAACCSIFYSKVMLRSCGWKHWKHSTTRTVASVEPHPQPLSSMSGNRSHSRHQ
ncbi:hypothetical protein DdX_11735 [Ditylenchus destructor]|uniref:Uncharacterized protein n=1 Tax=Ditylenchus destructor TaxID=166010 RepID=A0AAD4R4C3_9BILA|nr:hypothetical protein DdX_11735 [Ditylenchus destructor]